MSLGMNALKVLITLLLSASIALPAAASPVCEQRRDFQLTLPQQRTLTTFFNQLMALDQYRNGPDRRGVTYSDKFNQIIESTKSSLNTNRLREAGTEYLIILQLRQAVFETIGIDDPAYAQFHNRVRSILFFSDLAPRPLIDASTKLRRRINEWALTSIVDDANRLQNIAKAEALGKMINMVTTSTVQYAAEKSNQVDERLATYRQVMISGLGVGTLVSGLVFSGIIVSGASTAIGSSGLVLSGCAIGSAGAGFSAILERQYDRYANAYLESTNKGSSFVCELNNQVSSQKEDLFEQTADAFRSGATAGCAFTMGGLVAPKVVTWGVVGAVGLAASVKGVLSANDAYLAHKSYLIYQSLTAFKNAEASVAANNNARAEFYLRQSQQLAKQAGSQLLETILTGAVIPAFARGEVVHALQHGHKAISALIGKSSDNAAMAVHMIANYAESPNPGHGTTVSSNTP